MQKLRSVQFERILAFAHKTSIYLFIQDSILQQVKPLIHVDSLTEEDKTKISREGRNQYLENGDFYDGYFYRDVEGHILPAHPSLPRLINEWLAEQNRVI